METQAKRKARLEASFGKRPADYPDGEEIDYIRGYFDHRRRAAPAVFHLDETTWYDLSMDDVFRRVNHTLSTPGEQVLYAWLRTPALDEATYLRRHGLITYMEAHPAFRLQLQTILSSVGKRRAAQTIESFAPSRHSPARLWLSLLLPALLLLSGLLLPFLSFAPYLFVLLLLFIPFYHIRMTRQLEDNLPIVNAIISTVSAYNRIVKIAPGDPAFRDDLPPNTARGIKGITRLGGLSFLANNELAFLLNSLFLLDLILYELLKNRLSRLTREVSVIHEYVGSLDAAVAVASYRKAAAGYCDPALSFDPEEPSLLRAEGMMHPLLSHPVPNTLDAARPILLTGSNASGKSTFLKTVALNAILAQSIGTALCASYAASAFHIYSSMALSDDILAGESYFVTEIKAIRRIFEAADRGERVLCVVDEVLRGTNTVERIAASSELLLALAHRGCLCLAATHDIELCELLQSHFALYHFQERIVDGNIAFDYRLMPGAAQTRNAIRLLALMGFDREITARADARADAYRQTGCWEL